MALSLHSVERASERLADAGLRPREVLGVADRVARAFPNESVAVRLAAFGEHRGDAGVDILARESNGDELWAVCRNGDVKTVMFRRSTQPRTREAFGVDRVLRVA